MGPRLVLLARANTRYFKHPVIDTGMHRLLGGHHASPWEITGDRQANSKPLDTPPGLTLTLVLFRDVRYGSMFLST